MTSATTQTESKPISDRQREANRANAQRSTGPKTVEGKERSRLNALKHGLAATMLDAPGLDPEIVQARMDAWDKRLNPRNDEIQSVEIALAVRASFRLERCDFAMKQLVANAQGELVEEGRIDEIDHRNGPAEQYKLLMRYEINTERMLLKLLRDLRKRAKTAQTEAERPQPEPVQPQQESARNEPKSEESVPTETEVAESMAEFLKFLAATAKPANPPQNRHERRKAEKREASRNR